MLFVGMMIHAAAPKRPPHPAPNVRDDRDTPLLIEAGCAQPTYISDKTKVKYFSQQGWTGVIALNGFVKLVFMRTRFYALREP
jgi:hypothetical protein